MRHIGHDLMRYNKKDNFCSSLLPKQYVCCSDGDLQDHRPQPTSGGDCQVYPVGGGEGCWDIADKFGITKQEIEDFNKKTWGWPGCDGNIQLHQLICISKGNPPMPPTLPDVQCGPQKDGTTKPEGSFDFNSLNQCPLNACCDVWGYCGMTEEFCTPSPSSSGAPGTAAKDTNGCISNCGMDIKQSGPPAEFKKVAYFESWNYQRSCLHMSVDNMPSGFTHLHFAFATVSSDWNVVIDDKVKGQFEKFKNLKNVRKILSFGGWAFSTESGTFQRFRDATKPENREAFAKNAAKFLADNNLDGLDFDWEYPGAPDIPNVPPGGKEEGPNFLKFLLTLKKLLPAGKSLSIALPSSFWYLRPYPVALMSRTVDYFIYMTYDLHGQWDYGNKWTSPGCATGNCIRSHVNMTETKTALSMITKAGVPSNKVIVGVSSYGRSFRLQDGGCTGVTCLFTGSPTHSDAYKGRGTNTSGYIANAELAEIKAGGKYSTVNHWYDQASDSNIMVYGNDGQLDWVAYMDDEIKARRTSQFKGYNMGGTTDWAVDLAAFQPGDGGDDGGHPVDPPPSAKQCKDAKEWPDSKKVFGGVIPPIGDSAHYRLFNIVNLTPHKFVKVGHHEYQYHVEASDVEPWTTAPNYFDRAQFADNPVDDKAEVYYELQGTGLKFSALLRTHTKDQPSIIWDLTDMGLGSRETWPLGGSNLVILGSKETGFHTSLRTTPWHSGWMQSI
jgi:GH18 family chitinase